MRRIPLLITILTVAVLVVAAIVIGLLYRTSLSQQTALLAEIVENHARTMEAIARHEEAFARHESVPPDHGDPLSATLGQVRDANARFHGFGRTGEFTLALREGDSIVYLLNQGSTGRGYAGALPFVGQRGEPMRRALSGRTGTVIGPDYRGVTVLAAYAPVKVYGLGIVAKIDLTEVQAPFVRAGLISIVAALIVVLLGSLLFYRTTNPVLRQLQESESRQRNAQQLAHLGSWTLDLVKNKLTWSDEVYRIFGLRPQEFGATYEAFLAAVHPDDRAAVDAAYSNSVRENRDGYEIEHRVVRKDTGEVRVVLERCEHTRDAAGRIIRSTGMVHDITARKQAEEENAHQLAELQRWQVVMLDREERNIELKREVNELLHRLGEPIRYPSQAAEDAETRGRGE
jgi:PAS domain S-box-containing protein